MTDAPYAPAVFRIGPALGRARKLFAANAVIFFLLMAAAGVPAWAIARYASGYVVIYGSMLGAFFINSIISSVFNIIGQAVITFLALRQLRPGTAWHRSVPLYVIALAILLPILIDIGFILLVVPGLILMARWSIAIQTCVGERLAPFAALRRSAQLTQGHRWKILGVLMMFVIVKWLGSMGISLVPIWAGWLVNFWVLAGVSLIWSATWSAYWNCTLVAIYHDLRLIEGGIDAGTVAKVFD
jgi:hypothetical protein